MAVQVGVPSNFNAALQDNAVSIPLPSGSQFAWSTDDPTDQISILDPSTENVQIIVSANGTNRTSITVTASTIAPDGSSVSGFVTTELIPPAATHVYTVSVSQPTLAPGGRRVQQHKK